MAKEKQVSEEVKEKLDKICKEVVLQEEIIKLKAQLQQQLAQAGRQLVQKKQEVTLWENKIHQLSGGLATCNAILEKSQKAKVLELEGDNTKPKKNESSKPD